MPNRSSMCCRRRFVPHYLHTPAHIHIVGPILAVVKKGDRTIVGRPSRLAVTEAHGDLHDHAGVRAVSIGGHQLHLPVTQPEERESFAVMADVGSAQAGLQPSGRTAQRRYLPKGSLAISFRRWSVVDDGG